MLGLRQEELEQADATPTVVAEQGGIALMLRGLENSALELLLPLLR